MRFAFPAAPRTGTLRFLICSSTLVASVAFVSGTTRGQGPASAPPPTPAPVKASAASEVVRNTGAWNLDKSALALQGFDPVAYFSEGGGKATKGDAKIEVQSGGATYRFASVAHRDLFLANPGRYEPAHGGWCAWAMRDGEKVDVDPTSFIVRDGRLFVFYKGLFADTRAKWSGGDHAAEAQAADAHWKTLSGETPRTMASLQQALDLRREEFAKKTPPEALAAYEQGVKDIIATGVLDRALKVGAHAPDFELPDATGTKRSLASLLSNGPVVLTWYRGAWCPFCAIQLHEYQEALGDFKELGGQLVAISPQTPDASLSTAEKNALTFTVLSDSGNAIAERYGVRYVLPPAVAAMFKGRLDLKKLNGGEGDTLPLAATYVIDQTGTITYAFIDSDYRKRAEPTDIIAALRAIRDKRR